MDQKTFEAILMLLVPQEIDLIVKNYGLDEISATKAFCESKLYSVLEEEDTKVWHFSPLTLSAYLTRRKEQGRSHFRSKNSRKLGILSMQFERATYPMLFYTWVDTIWQR